MVLRTLELPASLDFLLRQVAFRSGKTKTDVIREMLQCEVDCDRKPKKIQKQRRKLMMQRLNLPLPPQFREAIRRVRQYRS